MTREEIDNLFGFYNNSDDQSIIEMVDEENLRNEASEAILQGEFEDNIKNKVLNNLMQQIKNSGQYEYLEEKGLSKNENNDDYVFVNLITTDRIPVAKAKEYIKGVKSYLKKDIIVATQDSDYIKECIENQFFGTEDLAKLIESTQDPEYIKQCLGDDSLGVSHNLNLVKATHDSEYIKRWMQPQLYGPFALTSSEKTLLIGATGDLEYIKQCVEDDTLKLDTKSKVDLIKETKEPEYIKQWVKDHSLELDVQSKVSLIKATKDVDYIKQCVKDDSLELDVQSKVSLIKATEEPEYIKQCVKDDSLEFDVQNKVTLIRATKDVDYIKQCVKDDSLKFDTETKVCLIKLTRDSDYIKECIEDESLMLSSSDKANLTLATRDEKFIKDAFIYKDIGENHKQIDLPKGMTIGVEIEAEGVQLTQSIFDGWKVKDDCSLKKGLEVVSPILTGSETDSQNIYAMCNILKNLGCDVSERCGGHVHIGADYLTTKEAYMNLIELWGNSEKLLYVISNETGEITREGGVKEYAQPISGEIEKALENGTINLKDEDELADFAGKIEGLQSDTIGRYSGLNFQSMNTHNTIEFRLANGTINPDTWIENINLFGGIIKASEQLAQIQKKQEIDRSPDEQQLLDLFENIKNKETGEEKRLDALLTLTVGEDKKDIYKTRYEVNSKLLADNPTLEDVVTTKVAKKSISIKDIGKKALTGPEPITGVDMMTAEARLTKDKSQLREQLKINTQEV